MPNLRSSIPWIEEVLPRHYRVKKVKLEKYMTLEEASLLIGSKPHHILESLRHHPKAHAIEWRGKLYIYPDSVRRLLARKYRRLINKELKKTWH